jgi:myo-inositol 2-dehydrogenase / D-chiro-inositol 1-dehydrogenase
VKSTQGKLRFGVLGVGRIGKVHIANLVNRIPGIEVVALADALASEASAVAGQFGVAHVFHNHEELLNSSEIDAVVVCTPTNTHHDIILAAASAGKHVFCEKPIELTLQKIERINTHVKKTGVQLMVGFNRRFDPNFAKLHETVQSGGIGKPEILRITSRDPAPPPVEYLRASGGIFLDMTIHDFDMARFLVGSEIVEVYAQTNVLVDPGIRAVGDWDTAVVTLRFENGAVGAIDNSRRAVYGYDQRAEVFGSEGMVAASNNTPDNHVRFDRTGGHTSPPLHFFMERYTESYLREMQAFVDAIRQAKPVPVDGTDGLKAVAIGLAAGLSARKNRPVLVSEVQHQAATI